MTIGGPFGGLGLRITLAGEGTALVRIQLYYDVILREPFDPAQGRLRDGRISLPR